MNNDSKKDMMRSCKSCLKRLNSLKFKDSLDFSMSVGPKDSSGSSSCFSKSIKSSSEFDLVKTVGAVMLMAGGISLVCSLCSLIKKK